MFTDSSSDKTPVWAVFLIISTVVALLLGIVGFGLGVRNTKNPMNIEGFAEHQSRLATINTTGELYLEAWANPTDSAKTITEQLIGADKAKTVFPKVMKTNPSVKPHMTNITPLGGTKGEKVRWRVSYMLDFTTNGIQLYTPFTAELTIVENTKDKRYWVENPPVLGVQRETISVPNLSIGDIFSTTIPLDSPSGKIISEGIIKWYTGGNTSDITVGEDGNATVNMPSLFTEFTIEKITTHKIKPGSTGDGIVQVKLKLADDYWVAGTIPVELSMKDNGSFELLSIGKTQ